MRYEQPEMEILLFGAKVDTIDTSYRNSEDTDPDNPKNDGVDW